MTDEKNTEKGTLSSNEISLLYDISTDTIHHLSPEITQVFGVARIIEHAPEFLVRCGVIQPESAHDFLECFRKIQKGITDVDCLLHARTAAGRLIWVQMKLTSYYNENGMPIRATGILHDVTSQYETCHANSSQNQQKANILKRSALLNYEIDLTDCKVLLGLDNIRYSVGADCGDDYNTLVHLLIDNVVYPDDRSLMKTIILPEQLLSEYQKGRTSFDVEYRRFLGHGVVGWVCAHISMTASSDSGHILLYVYVLDISDRKTFSQNLRERTEQDSLTGLYNTVTFELRLRGIFEKRQAVSDEYEALFLLNIDDFNAINQKNGHFFGDSILAEIGQNLRTSLAHNGLAGRIGGDEFVLYLQHFPTHESIMDTADSLRKSLYREGLSLTIGIAVFSESAAHPEELMQRAALALLEGKIQGKNCCVIYEDTLSVIADGPTSNLVAAPFTYKTFSENLTEYIFHILYRSKDLEKAILEVLELVAEYFNFSRAFLYEVTAEGGAECTFEWFFGKTDASAVMHRSLTPEEVNSCRQLMGPDGLHITKRDELTLEELERLEFDTEYRLLCALTGSMGYHGFIGFDNNSIVKEHLRPEDMKLIQSLSHMLDVFWSDRNSKDTSWESKFLLQALADGLHSCTYIIELETHLLRFSNENMLQVIPEAHTGTICYETIRGRKAPCDDCPFTHMLEDNTVSYQTEMYLDKYQLWAKISSTLVKSPTGKIYGIFNGYDFSTNGHDYDYQARDVSAFTGDTFLYSALSRSLDDYIYMCDLHNNLYHFPQEMVEEFDLPGQVIKDAIPLWAERIHEDDRDLFLRNFDNILSGRTDTLSQEYRVRNKVNVWIWFSTRGHVERDKHGRPAMFAGVMTKLGQKSKIDSLTGLPNKYEFELRMRSLFAKDVRKGALLLLGLDNFKYINDMYGWAFGDAVLQESTQRLLDELPKNVQLYRLDGDKFGAFLPDMEQADVEKYFSTTAMAFRSHRQHGIHRYFCTISGGCAFFDAEQPDCVLLYKQATFALDYAKRRGKNRLAVYNENQMGSNERLLQIITDLNTSVDMDFPGFSIHYQPQIKPASFRISSAEALLRWTSPELGAIPPGEFIPLLEQSGLIHRVGRWILEEADRVCCKWRTVVPDFTISVNLSYIQLRDASFFPYLTEQIEKGRIHPSYLHLEITESCISDGSKLLTEQFQILRDLGFKIEMDDFGTGYSSLEILKNAPSDVVKIDRAFVRDLGRSKFDSTFIQFVTTLCHSVGILVCLEGVESCNEYDLVEPMHLDLIQGFLFGRPVPEAEFENVFLRKTPDEVQSLLARDRQLFKA